jgi:hypothetical protein
MPRGLYDSLLNDPVGWDDLGDLVGAQSFEKAEDIKERAANLAKDMALRRQQWAKVKVG